MHVHVYIYAHSTEQDLLLPSSCGILYCMYYNLLYSLLGETEHWVCTCSLKGSSAVMVMDSMALFLSLNNSTILQISKIYRVPNCNSTLEIRTVSVQQQKGSSDCGLVGAVADCGLDGAVVYAVEVCLGRNPQYARFDQTRMRNHLYECLTEGVMKPFPRSDYETLPRPSPLVLYIKIYCKCRMPEDYDENMVCCDGCEDWYHMSCVNLKINKLRERWLCHVCEVASNY